MMTRAETGPVQLWHVGGLTAGKTTGLVSPVPRDQTLPTAKKTGAASKTARSPLVGGKPARSHRSLIGPGATHGHSERSRRDHE